MFVPSFGEWGYVLARAHESSQHPLVPTKLPASTGTFKYLDDATLRQLFVLGRDMEAVDVEINRLDNQVLVHYYEAEWKRFHSAS